MMSTRVVLEIIKTVFDIPTRKIVASRGRAQLNLPLLLLQFMGWSGDEEVTLHPLKNGVGFVVLKEGVDLDGEQG